MSRDAITPKSPESFVIPPEAEAELAKLAERYRNAGGLGLRILNLLGDQAEGLVDRLPAEARTMLEEATVKALKLAMRTVGAVSDGSQAGPAWFDRAAAAASGAAGGWGGLPTALAELPVTVAVLLGAIQNVAREHGFDPADPEIEAECLAVLAADGPLAPGGPQGLDLGLLAARSTIRGSTLAALLSRVAPRLASALGQKLAAQMVPLLGAVAGAATNYAYVGYYQEIAQVHFRLRRLAQELGAPPVALAAELRFRLAGAGGGKG